MIQDYLQSNFSLSLVALSYVIAVLGSFLALALAKQALLRSSQSQRLWISLLAAVSLGGIGIWSMHFIGMLAYQESLSYSFLITFISLLIAIATVTIGFWLISSGRFGYAKLIGAGIIVGLGVVAMHYMGMAAVSATLSYNMDLVYLSAVIAVVAATVALWLMMHVSSIAQMVVAAIVMGVAVCGMHYTGMAAVTIETAGSYAVAPFEKLSLAAIIVFVDAAVLVVLGLMGFIVFKENERALAPA